MIIILAIVAVIFVGATSCYMMRKYGYRPTNGEHHQLRRISRKVEHHWNTVIEHGKHNHNE